MFKKFGYDGIRKMRVGKSLICSAILFLASALLITLAPNLPLVIVGQCLYVIAPDFYGVSDILLKKLCARANDGKDYVESRSFSSTLYSTITLVAALLVGPLMDINPYLPMVICIVARALSLALAIFIHARSKGLDEQERYQTSVPKKGHFGRATVEYLFMAAFFGALSSLSITYLKLLLQDNLAVIFDEATVVVAFSGCIVVSRVVKILGNLITKQARKSGVGYERLGILLSLGAIVAVVCGLVGVILADFPAVVATALGLFCIYSVYDTMFVVQSYLVIEHLNEDQSITALYRKGLLDGIVSSIASTLMTAALAASSYLGVMILLLVISLAVLVFGILGKRYRGLRARDYSKDWPAESVENTDSLLVSATALMIHYGAVRSTKFNPSELEERVGSVEHIEDHYRRFGYVGKYPYSFDGLFETYNDGNPCAVLGSRNGEDRWYPVLYLDKDGGVVNITDSGALFLSDFEDIRELCVFTLEPRRKS